MEPTVNEDVAGVLRAWWQADISSEEKAILLGQLDQKYGIKAVNRACEMVRNRIDRVFAELV